jgi:hypothetical protein
MSDHGAFFVLACFVLIKLAEPSGKLCGRLVVFSVLGSHTWRTQGGVIGRKR